MRNCTEAVCFGRYLLSCLKHLKFLASCKHHPICACLCFVVLARPPRAMPMFYKHNCIGICSMNASKPWEGEKWSAKGVTGCEITLFLSTKKSIPIGRNQQVALFTTWSIKLPIRLNYSLNEYNKHTTPDTLGFNPQQWCHILKERQYYVKSQKHTEIYNFALCIYSHFVINLHHCEIVHKCTKLRREFPFSFLFQWLHIKNVCK